MNDGTRIAPTHIKDLFDGFTRQSADMLSTLDTPRWNVAPYAM